MRLINKNYPQLNLRTSVHQMSDLAPVLAGADRYAWGCCPPPPFFNRPLCWFAWSIGTHRK